MVRIQHCPPSSNLCVAKRSKALRCNRSCASTRQSESDRRVQWLRDWLSNANVRRWVDHRQSKQEPSSKRPPCVRMPAIRCNATSIARNAEGLSGGARKVDSAQWSVGGLQKSIETERMFGTLQIGGEGSSFVRFSTREVSASSADIASALQRSNSIIEIQARRNSDSHLDELSHGKRPRRSSTNALSYVRTATAKRIGYWAIQLVRTQSRLDSEVTRVVIGIGC